MTTCGNEGCGEAATSARVLSVGPRRLLFYCCDGCRAYLTHDYVSVGIRISEEGLEVALAIEVMEDCEVRDSWSPESFGAPKLGSKRGP